MGIIAESGACIRIVGHGIKVDSDTVIAPGVTVSIVASVIDSSFGSRTVGELRNTLNIMAMEPLADFSLMIEGVGGTRELAGKAWNALWVFHLLSLACWRPVMPLYSVSSPATSGYRLANRNIVIHRLPTVGPVSAADLAWAADHFDSFDALLREPRFNNAMRAYGNAHYLLDDDAKIMLLGAGIEGLLGVDAELRRRIALHAAILHDGSAAEKAAYFSRIKKGYDIRSKVVHGAGVDPETLSAGYHLASDVLLGLLRKVVQLSRCQQQLKSTHSRPACRSLQVNSAMLVRDIVAGSEQAIECKAVFDSVGSHEGAVRRPWRSDRSRYHLQSVGNCI